MPPVVLGANPRSSQTSVLEEPRVPLVPQVISVNQTVLLHFKAALLSAWTPLTLLPWLSYTHEFTAGSYSTHVASVGLWFWQRAASLFFQVHRVQLGC